MTNLRKFFGIVLLATMIVALASCKKDETAASFTIIGNSSIDFEYNQTKEVSFTTNKIAKYNAPTIPEGWTCTRSGKKYIITSPAEGNTGAVSLGSIDLSVVSDEGATITRTLVVSIRIAEEITSGPANSIIVREPYKRYKFNALRRGNETAETLKGLATGGQRLWTTSTSAIVKVSFENGYIFFSTGNATEIQEANAVVAVTGKDDEILWSWHIWATDYDPAADPDQVGGLNVMNRNLGAFTNSNASGADAWRSYGLYYQWGRKDPFVGPDAWDSNTQMSIYDTYGSYVSYAYEVSTDETGTIEYATTYPATFISGGAEESGYDWLYGSHNNSLWTSTGAKSLYDPCPDGWRVAPSSVWAPNTTGNTLGDYNYGWTFATDDDSDIYYPAAGRRSYSPTLAYSARNFTNVVNDGEGVGYPVGFYWSADATAFYFNQNGVSPALSLPRAGGFPLRCVEE